MAVIWAWPELVAEKVAVELPSALVEPLVRESTALLDDAGSDHVKSLVSSTITRSPRWTLTVWVSSASVTTTVWDGLVAAVVAGAVGAAAGALVVAGVAGACATTDPEADADFVCEIE